MINMQSYWQSFYSLYLVLTARTVATHCRIFLYFIYQIQHGNSEQVEDKVHFHSMFVRCWENIFEHWNICKVLENIFEHWNSQLQPWNLDNQANQGHALDQSQCSTMCGVRECTKTISYHGDPFNVALSQLRNCICCIGWGQKYKPILNAFFVDTDLQSINWTHSF